MNVYNYTYNGLFTGTEIADPNPVRPGQFLIPANATTIKPPDFDTSKEVALWNGSAWEIQNIPQPEPEPEPEPQPITWDTVRLQRENSLLASDWVGLTDSNPSNKETWLAYRQALRDIPQTFTTPESVVWPTMPQ
jgi:hypothetical protein